MDWREMIRVAGAINPSGGAGTTDSPAQIMSTQESPIRQILNLLSTLGREEGNPPVVPGIPDEAGISLDPIMSDDPRRGGITGHMPWPPQNGTPNLPPLNNPTPAPVSNQAPPIMQPGNPIPWEQNPEAHVSPGLPQEEDDPIARIMKMYQPDHEITDIVKNMVLHPPVRNKPSKLQLILGLTAAGLRQDPELGERTMYKPYYHELEDYNQKLRPLQILAGLERGENSNERALAIAMMRDEVAQRRADIASRKVEGDIKIRERSNEIKEKVLRMRDAQGKYLFKVGKDEFLYAIDKTNPSAPAIKTDLKTSDIDKLELAELTHEYRMSEIGKTGEEARKTAEVRGEEARKTKVVVPGKNTTPTGPKAGTGANKPMSELEKQRRIRTNWQKIISDNPGLSTEFEFDTNKLPHVKAKTKLSKEQQAELKRRLRTGVDFPDEPQYWPRQEVPAAAPTPNVNRPGAGINQPPATYWMLAPDGKTVGQVAPSEVERLKKGKYVVITEMEARRRIEEARKARKQ